MSEHATYRIGNVIAVTQRLGDGTWIATFPGFIGFGAAESDALVALAAEVEGASKRLRLQAIVVTDAGELEAIRATDARVQARKLIRNQRKEKPQTPAQRVANCCDRPKTRGPNTNGQLVCPVHCSKCGHDRKHEDYLDSCSECRPGDPCRENT